MTETAKIRDLSVGERFVHADSHYAFQMTNRDTFETHETGAGYATREFRYAVDRKGNQVRFGVDEGVTRTSDSDSVRLCLICGGNCPEYKDPSEENPCCGVEWADNAQADLDKRTTSALDRLLNALDLTEGVDEDGKKVLFHILKSEMSPPIVAPLHDGEHEGLNLSGPYTYDWGSQLDSALEDLDGIAYAVLSPNRRTFEERDRLCKDLVCTRTHIRRAAQGMQEYMDVYGPKRFTFKPRTQD